MKVGIVGLGLIGGSLAKAYKESGQVEVYGWDTDADTMLLAKTVEAIDGTLDETVLPDCDLLLLALYPGAAIEYLRAHAPEISKKTFVIDCCGVKQVVCDACFPIAEQYGFSFFGGHPMAGTQFSGFAKSRSSLFRGASMILVPPRFDDIAQLDQAKQLLAPVGFGRTVVTTADKHDEMIAFTSQMAHIVSNAFIKSPAARQHKGFSAGSYKDLTRVAWLNETMWTELFMDNRKKLIREIDILMHSLEEYKEAMQQEDAPRLKELLREGRICKEEVDGGR